MDTNGFLIVERIDSLLKKKGETRVQIAQAIGIKPQNISAWSVRGTIPAVDVALKIAKFLDVDIWWLVFGESEEAPELTAEQKKLLAAWDELSQADKEEIEMLIDFKNKAAKAKSVPADSVG